MNYIKQTIEKIHIHKLKGLVDLEMTFKEKGLTAILGINGAGKSTVLHALACAYKPMENSDRHNYKFNQFFLPTPNSSWQGSNFELIHSYTNIQKGSNGIFQKNHNTKRIYSKNSNRWTPRYRDRTPRNVYYLGIDTCLPMIEKNKSKTPRNVTFENSEIINQSKVLEKAKIILGKNYLEHKEYKSNYSDNLLGVKFGNIEYSAFSMGAGEQRVFKILEVAEKAEKYSLILIDEIDLLLHSLAFKKLIFTLVKIAAKKELQIIFTTHEESISNFSDKVEIRHIWKEEITNKTLCFEKNTPDILYRLTGIQEKPLSIYVEDHFAKIIIEQIASSLRIKRNLEVKLFGAAKNAFTLVSGLLLKGENIKNSLFVLDGDVYNNESEKLDMLKKSLTGKDNSIQDLRTKALEQIKEFSLPKDLTPEKHLLKMITNLNHCENLSEEDIEIINIAQEINACSDNHDYINYIIDRLGYDKIRGYDKVIQTAKKSSEWSDYIKPISDWLLLKKDELNFQ
ncbi:hypothetical protein PM10SUCC1_20500 [Propionigenium maris DSM 9537]|uniref:AAA+ ATPase domain-containing protein n=1 Tax=Propionigenium maris DSM 9537 TaxID=1123000 RepID=A0A9W6LMP2_9FUSO|nr:AAA family ATPase [Propionigenium maris]GLI56536.1 hypothetical protein PM10SUCC1_20500 [Propionigenium maris DSM 9537]